MHLTRSLTIFTFTMASSPLPHLSTFIVRNGFLEVEAFVRSEIVQRVRAGVADTDPLVLVSWELLLLHRVADVGDDFLTCRQRSLRSLARASGVMGGEGALVTVMIRRLLMRLNRDFNDEF